MERSHLADLRTQMRISRAELAKALGVSESTIEKVEKGTRNPSLKLARRWGDYLGINDIWSAFYQSVSDTLSGDHTARDETCAASA